jgi:hypothetical protein
MTDIRDEYPRYPVGTVLWRMRGHETAHGKTEWHAVPTCIEYADKLKFLDAYKCGGSWNSIGKNYWLTREECLADFEEHRERWENAGNFRKARKYKQLGAIESDDVVFTKDEDMLVVMQEGLTDRKLIDTESLPWKVDEDRPAEYGLDEQYITLGMIRDALKKDGDEMNVITVWHMGALNGEVYETGNYREEKAWRLHGLTLGYA